MKEIHLICNAHLDPVWLWEWEEGAAEALSTFRIAATFCEQYDGFVFNHNEALLYEWVQEHDKALFQRIRNLVKAGRWHVMGGWYLQPDCNLPSGESIVRQILLGRSYFDKQLGVRPTTAINFDPFGHSRGLVQILAKSGFDSYLFCRPFEEDLPLPDDEFMWIGYDGSSVVGHRAFGHYLSQYGEAVAKVRSLLDANLPARNQLLLWGIGNHGGGPSKLDMEQLEAIRNRPNEFSLHHSTPEAYFRARSAERPSRPHVARSLNPWAPGCYTSQVRIKQQHRALEDDLSFCEKIVAQTALRGLIDYPISALLDARKDLAFAQFHDILPGTSIEAVETESLERLGHGRQICRRLVASALLASLRGDSAPSGDSIPVYAYNPHPYPLSGVFEFEIQPATQNWEGTFTDYRVGQIGLADSVPIVSQLEHEDSAVNVDWRKRIAIDATLPPSSLTRFECTPLSPSSRSPLVSYPVFESFIFEGESYEVRIGTHGLIDSFVRSGVDRVDGTAFTPLVLNDRDDSWLTDGRQFGDIAGEFTIATLADARRIAGNNDLHSPINVIEQGEVRTVIESILTYGSSWIVFRYSLSRRRARIDLHLRVNWQEPQAMLKLGLPLHGTEGQFEFLGQTMFGYETIPQNGDETIAQRWLLGGDETHAVSIINDGTYGISAKGRSVFLTLLRSVAYAAHPTKLGAATVPENRYIRRMDTGIREFRFAMMAGSRDERLSRVDREAAVFGEKPRFLMAYPTPSVEPNSARLPAISISDAAVRLSALKRADNDRGWIIRLFESSGATHSTELKVPDLGIDEQITLQAFQVLTLLVSDGDSHTREVNMIEETDAEE
jgi:alpha-mannosidase